MDVIGAKMVENVPYLAYEEKRGTLIGLNWYFFARMVEEEEDITTRWGDSIHRRFQNLHSLGP